jgi:hypothetical protein
MAPKVEKAFQSAQLGFAYMSLATFNDFESGPNIKVGMINPRMPSAKALKALYESTNRGSKVINNIADNAIHICLPRSYITPSSLSTNCSEAGFVEWAPQSLMGTADKAYLANGLHRWWMVISHLCKDEICMWEELKVAYADAVEKNNKEAKEKVEGLLQSLKPKLRENSKWLVLFFDSGKHISPDMQHDGSLTETSSNIWIGHADGTSAAPWRKHNLVSE